MVGGQEGLQQGNERRGGVTVRDAEPYPIRALDLDFRCRHPPGCGDFDKVRDVRCRSQDLI